MIATDITTILDETAELELPLDPHIPWAYGGKFQRDRIISVAEYCIQHWEGNIVEIGCFVGATTSRLAQLAQQHGRRVIAVDPWESGTQQCVNDTYTEFLKNTEPYRDIIDVIRLPSQDPKAKDLMAQESLCFALVDGLHTHAGCLSDILSTGHCQGIIAVDDLTTDYIQRAFDMGVEQLKRPAIIHAKCREGYILPCK